MAALIVVVYSSWFFLATTTDTHNSLTELLDGYRKEPSIIQKKKEVAPSTISKTSSSAKKNQQRKILTIYMETVAPPGSSSDNRQNDVRPLPVRTTANASKLRKVEFPQYGNNHDALICGSWDHPLSQTTIPPLLPVNEFPDRDPYLPWIHDYVVEYDVVHFIAQNKRRCETGDGKEIVMKYWEPQMSLFQPVPIHIHHDNHQQLYYRLASSWEEATIPETRFICYFHRPDDDKNKNATMISFSQFPFNYEYVAWKKKRLPMYKTTGADVSKFETSQLLFSCPIPPEFRQQQSTSSSQYYYLDVVPIRTPPRRDQILLGEQHVGPNAHLSNRFDLEHEFGKNHVLPNVLDSGRWANLPICPVPPPQENKKKRMKKYQFVACTWTSASYQRRGDATTIADSEQRLREWIIFHQLVGIDHIILFDNTQPDSSSTSASSFQSPLEGLIVEEFSGFVTYIPWSATVCNNNRPNHPNPGERSSQYAADASCRVRYGPITEWMTFIDIDEYLVPMAANKQQQDHHQPLSSSSSSWHDVLDAVGDEYDILNMKSSRGNPRLDLMEMVDPKDGCQKRNRRKSKLREEPCVVPRRNETFLRVYNCDFIKHPRPERFGRARKQIYRPAQVLSHFVHYSPVHWQMARYYADGADGGDGRLSSSERYLDELAEGVLIHTKSVLPYETMTRTVACQNASRHSCNVGHACPDSTEFVDEIHQKNLFHDERGKYCNCWIDPHVETYWIPRLEKALASGISYS